MGKLIIENRSSVSDFTATEYVLQVMNVGRVSNNGKQYCYLTVMNNGICVTSFLNKKSDRFVVYDDKSRKC